MKVIWHMNSNLISIVSIVYLVYVLVKLFDLIEYWFPHL